MSGDVGAARELRREKERRQMTPDEAWKGLHQDLSAHDIHIASILAHHRRIIEAAVRAEQWEDIRAESAGTLDELREAVDRVLTARDMFGNLAFDDPALVALWDARYGYTIKPKPCTF